MAYASVIGSSAVIRGNVRGDTSLEILGRVEGDVGVTGDLALGPDAVVLGAVSGARIVIGGSVEGDVTGTEAVSISETGRVIGDLAAPRIGMSEGAHVRGNVRTEGGAGNSRAASRSGSEVRSAAAPRPPAERSTIERPAERPAPVVTPASASPTNSGSTSSAPNRAPLKKAPPPPVIHAPRPGARARKKLGRRMG